MGRGCVHGRDEFVVELVEDRGAVQESNAYLLWKIVGDERS